MARRRRREAPKLQTPLSDSLVELMLAAIIRHPESFATASTELKSNHFRPHELGLANIWAVVKEHHDKNGTLPNEEHLLAELNAKLEHDHPELDDDVYDDVDRFISQAFSLRLRDIKPAVIVGYLRRFLEERLLDELKLTVDADTRDLPAESIFDALQVIHATAARIKTLSEDQVAVPFPADWTISNNPVQMTPTNVGFFDYYLGGGIAADEVYTLLGPFGSCKTTLAVQLSVSAADLANRQWHDGGCAGPLPVCYMVAYEDSMDEIRLRAIAHQAKIPWAKLAQGQPGALSCSGELLPYEREMFASELAGGAPVDGERERESRAREKLNINWRILSMSGRDSSNRAVGTGYIDELAGVIKSNMRASAEAGQAIRPHLIVIDYAKAMIRRHLHATNQSYDDLRHYINDIVNELRDKIAQPFQCSCLITHQLSSAVAERLRPGQVPDHTSSAEGKGFSENAHFAFSVGKPDADNRCVFACTKHRRMEKHIHRVVQIDGEYATVRDTAGEYVIDPTSDAILPAIAASTVGVSIPDDDDSRPRPATPGRAVRSSLRLL